MVPGGEFRVYLASAEDVLVDAVKYAEAHDTPGESCSSSDGSCHTRDLPCCKAEVGQANYTRCSPGVVSQPVDCYGVEPLCYKGPSVAEQGSFRFPVRKIGFLG